MARLPAFPNGAGEYGSCSTVPDLDINTQGKDRAEAIYMARDAIGLWGICEQDDGRIILKPSTSEPPHESGEPVSWVNIDFLVCWTDTTQR